MAASPGSTGTKKKGSISAALVERKEGGGGGADSGTLQFSRAENEDIPCGQKENIDWLAPLSFPFTIPVHTPG